MSQEVKTTVIKRVSVLFALMVFVSVLFGVVIPSFFPALAVQPPSLISYQGRILNTNGVPVADSVLDMEFRLYTAANGGTCVWSNSSATCDGNTPASTTPISVSLTDGLFAVNLGDTSAGFAAIPESVFADSDSIYLEVEIAGETLSPRKRVVSVGYALNANTLDGIDSTGFLAADGDVATGIFDFTGAVLRGTAALVFEGSSQDDFETVFAITNPTHDNTITFQDGTGTVAFLSDITGGDLDEAYDLFSTQPLVNVDYNDGSAGLEFSLDAANSHFVIDMQSTSDVRFQDAGSTFFAINDDQTMYFSSTAASTVLSVVADSVTASSAVTLQGHGITDGSVLTVASSGQGLSTGGLMNLLNAGTRTSTGAISGNLFSLTRTINNNSGGLLTLNGDFFEIRNDPTNISGTLTDTSRLIYLNQENPDHNGAVLQIINEGIGESIWVDQRGNTGDAPGGVGTDFVSAANGGAVHIINTHNDHHALTVWSNNAGTAVTPLVHFEANFPFFGQDVMEIRRPYAGAAYSGGGLFINLDDPGNTQNAIKDDQALYVDTSATGSSSVLAVESDDTVGDNVIFNIDANGDFQYDGTGTSPAADIAEVYASTDVLEPGDVVAINTGAVETVRKTSSVYESGLFGAVSTKPALRLGSETVGYDIALTGRIPLKVSAENGEIRAGDPLTSSGTPGYAMKATDPGMIVGFALEGHTNGVGMISAFVNASWYAGNLIAADNGRSMVKGDMMIDKLGVATSASKGVASRAFSFRGSGWNGAAAVDRDMTILVEVEDADDYELSFKNTNGSQVAFLNRRGDFALTGNLYPSDRGVMQTSKYIYYDGSGGPGGDFMRTNAAGWGTGSYDFAEMFPSSDVLSPGEIVVFGNSKEEVKRSGGTTYDLKIAGIVSTRPGFLAGDNKPGHTPIALAGRVPTKVTNENGAIRVGDPLTTSSTPGHAMKAIEPGPIVGYAMESFDGSAGSIIAFVRVSYFSGQSETPFAANTASELTNISLLSMNGNINMNSGSIFSVTSINGLGGWKIAANGDISTRGQFIHKVSSYQNEQVDTYAALGRHVTIQLTGTAQLANGSTQVMFETIDPKFNDIISAEHAYRIFLTPSGATGQLYVTDRTTTGFTIRETGGLSETAVDWMVIGYHKDFPPPATIVPEVASETISDESVVEEPTVGEGDDAVENEETTILDPAGASETDDGESVEEVSDTSVELTPKSTDPTEVVVESDPVIE